MTSYIPGGAVLGRLVGRRRPVGQQRLAGRQRPAGGSAGLGPGGAGPTCNGSPDSAAGESVGAHRGCHLTSATPTRATTKSVGASSHGVALRSEPCQPRGSRPRLMREEGLDGLLGPREPVAFVLAGDDAGRRRATTR